MPRLRATAISALIVLLGLALPVQAAPAPIVFDFEDGLQGWELHGGATRVQTQVLGGEWTIFMGNLAGVVWISMEVEELTVSGWCRGQDSTDKVHLGQAPVGGVRGGLRVHIRV